MGSLNREPEWRRPGALTSGYTDPATKDEPE
jgi:hypothetical protein